MGSIWKQKLTLIERNQVDLYRKLVNECQFWWQQSYDIHNGTGKLRSLASLELDSQVFRTHLDRWREYLEVQLSREDTGKTVEEEIEDMQQDNVSIVTQTYARYALYLDLLSIIDGNIERENLVRYKLLRKSNSGTSFGLQMVDIYNVLLVFTNPECDVDQLIADVVSLVHLHYHAHFSPEKINLLRALLCWKERQGWDIPKLDFEIELDFPYCPNIPWSDEVGQGPLKLKWRVNNPLALKGKSIRLTFLDSDRCPLTFLDDSMDRIISNSWGDRVEVPVKAVPSRSIEEPAKLQLEILASESKTVISRENGLLIKLKSFEAHSGTLSSDPYRNDLLTIADEILNVSRTSRPMCLYIGTAGGTAPIEYLIAALKSQGVVHNRIVKEWSKDEILSNPVTPEVAPYVYLINADEFRKLQRKGNWTVMYPRTAPLLVLWSQNGISDEDFSNWEWFFSNSGITKQYDVVIITMVARGQLKAYLSRAAKLRDKLGANTVDIVETDTRSQKMLKQMWGPYHDLRGRWRTDCENLLYDSLPNVYIEKDAREQLVGWLMRYPNWEGRVNGVLRQLAKRLRGHIPYISSEMVEALKQEIASDLDERAKETWEEVLHEIKTYKIVLKALWSANREWQQPILTGTLLYCIKDQYPDELPTSDQDIQGWLDSALGELVASRFCVQEGLGYRVHSHLPDFVYSMLGV